MCQQVIPKKMRRHHSKVSVLNNESVMQGWKYKSLLFNIIKQHAYDAYSTFTALTSSGSRHYAEVIV